MRMRRFWAVCLFAMIWFVVSGVMASAQQTVLKFAAWDYELNQYDRELIEAFERANPDIKVEVYDFPANEYPDKILIMLAGGEDLDVFYANPVSHQ